MLSLCLLSLNRLQSNVCSFSLVGGYVINIIKHFVVVLSEYYTLGKSVLFTGSVTDLSTLTMLVTWL